MGENGWQLTTQQIGKLGELLVQFELLRHGLESAPMTTDSGIDLVVYAPRKQHPFTIQVKTNLSPKAGGGKGRLALDWWVACDCPAEFYALVDISSCRVWLLSKQDLAEAAQQESNGRYHIYMYVEQTSRPTKHARSIDRQFAGFLIEQRVCRLL